MNEIESHRALDMLVRRGRGRTENNNSHHNDEAAKVNVLRCIITRA